MYVLLPSHVSMTDFESVYHSMVPFHIISRVKYVRPDNRASASIMYEYASWTSSPYTFSFPLHSSLTKVSAPFVIFLVATAHAKVPICRESLTDPCHPITMFCKFMFALFSRSVITVWPLTNRLISRPAIYFIAGSVVSCAALFL